jgi:hypothetical protein
VTALLLWPDERVEAPVRRCIFSGDAEYGGIDRRRFRHQAAASSIGGKPKHRAQTSNSSIELKR